MAIEAVIFDLDGTITEPFFDFDAIRAEIGLGRASGTILEAMDDMTAEQLKRCEAILYKHEKRAVGESRLNPGAKETLDALAARGIKLGILTRNRRGNALAVLQKHNLKFEVVLGREDGPAKPEAHGVLRICREFGVGPDETMVVGDYIYDLQSAHAAGAVGVLLASHERAEEFATEADFVIERIDQIPDIIDKQVLWEQSRPKNS